MNLKNWFLLKIKRPIIALAAAFTVLLCVLIASTYFLNRAQQEVGFLQFKTILSVALMQKNRPLAEEILDAAKVQLNANETFICKSGKLILGHQKDLTRYCHSTQGPLQRVYEERIQGFDDYSVYMTFPVLDLRLEHLLIFIALVFTVLVFMYATRAVILNFETEVLSVLQTDIFKEKMIPIIEFEEIRSNFQKLKNFAVLEAESRALINISKQVSHDIRSPVSVLNLVLSDYDKIDYERIEIAQLALERINSISNKVLENSRKNSPKNTSFEKTKLVSISDAISEIVKEKKFEFIDDTNLELNFNSEILDNLTIEFEKTELKSLISNLINNSYEALDKKRKIILNLSKSQEFILLKISDSGNGMDQNILEKLGKTEFSFGRKKNGSGNGIAIYSAFQLMKKYRGEISFNSEVGVGTTVNLRFRSLV